MKAFQGTLILSLLGLVLTAGCNQKTSQTKQTLKFKTSQVELTGQTSDYGLLRTDGTADFGLVLKNFSKERLLNIKLDDLMSTSTDRIRVFGQSLDLPSNVALPDQRERYIFSIHINKPTYRIYFEPNQKTSNIILHGQFPFTDVIDGFRNGTSLLELAGLFNILSYSITDGATYSSGQQVQRDLAVGKNLLKETQKIQAPSQVPRGFKFVAVSLISQIKNTKTYYFPTDIKVIEAGMTNEIKFARQNPYILRGIFHSSFVDPESQNILKYKRSLVLSSDLGSFVRELDFVEDLNYTTNNDVQFSAPSLSSEQQKQGVKAIGVSVRIFKTHNQQGQKLDKEALVFTDFQTHGWQKFNLNSFEKLRDLKATYRLEISLHASRNAIQATTYKELMQNTELITQNAIRL